LKKLFVFALSVLFSFCLFSQEEKKPDFRKAFWGMSQEEVKKLESEKPIDENSERLTYKDNLFGIDCSVAYLFVKDKFYKGIYVFSEPMNVHSREMDYLNDYDNIKSKLKEKYGKPKNNRTTWKHNLYKDEPADWGIAVSIGHLVKWCDWDKPGVIIRLLLFGENHKIGLTLGYEHPDFEKIQFNDK